MFSINKLYLFFFIILLFSLLDHILQTIIVTDSLVLEYFQDQISHERIIRMIDMKQKWGWLHYLLMPLIYLLKFTLVSFWILCGAIIFNFNLSFRLIFKVVLTAELVWIMPSLLSIVWFGLIDTTYTFNDVQYFAPFSLLSLFDATSMDSWLIFPLKSLNLFEVIYLLVLALGIKKVMKKDYDSALKFTLPVYGSALVVWILFVTFLSINLGA